VSIFIRLALSASKTREMSQNSKRICPYSSPRSSILVSVINCNCYRFRDIHA